MELEKRVEKTAEKRVDDYSPNNKKENIIDITIAVSAITGYILYNYPREIQDAVNQAYQFASNIYQFIEPFINS